MSRVHLFWFIYLDSPNGAKNTFEKKILSSKLDLICNYERMNPCVLTGAPTPHAQSCINDSRAHYWMWQQKFSNTSPLTLLDLFLCQYRKEGEIVINPSLFAHVSHILKSMGSTEFWFVWIESKIDNNNERNWWEELHTVLRKLGHTSTGGFWYTPSFWMNYLTFCVEIRIDMICNISRNSSK